MNDVLGGRCLAALHDRISFKLQFTYRRLDISLYKLFIEIESKL